MDLKITELDANTTPIGADLLAIVDDVAGTPATQKITLTNLGIVDGWIPASETWSYASASTITVPSGAASKYVKGDKIKLTQTTIKYFNVVSVADTVLTVTGGSDYTVADAAITLNYYSHSSSPIGFPIYFNYLVVWSLRTGTLTTTYGNRVGRFNISKGLLSGEFFMVLDTVSEATASKVFQVNYPVTPATTGKIVVGNGFYLDSGTDFNNCLLVGESTLMEAWTFGNALADATFGSSAPNKTLNNNDSFAGHFSYMI